MEPQYKNWLTDIFRQILMWLDMGIYSLMRFVIQGVFDLANLTTSTEMVNGIYMRIYVLLGVFMVFKLSFSFFTYIVDPESMTNGKEKGVGKLISNTIVMLAMLISLPTILFGNVNGEPGLINRAQTALLPMLPRILLGIESGTGVSSGDEGAIAQASDTMAAAALMPFFAPAEGISSVCSEYASVEVPAIKSLSDFQEFALLSCNNSGGGVPIVGYFTASGLYVYHYSYGLSTVVGIIMLVILAGITIDVGKRVFKLLILQMIAPVPIMSYIDPKSSKDGAFAGWLKNLTTTFLDLFLKLGLVYLILMFIEAIVVNKTLFTNFPAMTDIRAYYLILILIIALLMFAKEAPKFIKDSLGIKPSKDGSKSFLGSMLGKAAGLAGGSLAGAASGFLSGGLHGAAVGAATGAQAGFNAAGTGKPSGAWRAGGDSAIQAVTGDKNRKSGILANMQRHQLQRIGQREGATEENAEIAKRLMYDKKNESDRVYDNYKEKLKNGTATEADWKAVTDARYAAGKAESNYKKINDRAEATGNSRTDYEKMREGRPIHKAIRNVREFPGRVAESIRGPEENNLREMEQELRETNQIMEGSRFDPLGRSGGDLSRHREEVRSRIDDDGLRGGESGPTRPPRP